VESSEFRFRCERTPTTRQTRYLTSRAGGHGFVIKRCELRANMYAMYRKRNETKERRTTEQRGRRQTRRQRVRRS